MKRILIHTAALRRATLVIFFALILVACAAPPAPAPTGEQPTAAPPEPTQTAAVIIQTVVVTVVPTNVPPEAPSATPLPPPTEAPTATQPPAATEAVVAAPPEASGGPIMVDDALGAGYFISMSRDRNDFSLRCQLNKAITFSVIPNNTDITQVDFYYRIEDRTTGAVFDWQNAGRMIPDANGNFVMVFSGEKVNANFRKPNAWFDYQFIGSNASGVIGRSAKIEKQVAYTFDCP